MKVSSMQDLQKCRCRNFFISHDVRDSRLVNLASQFLKEYFFFTNCRTCNNAGHARESCRNLQETLLILAGMDITTFVPVQACRTITAGLHECIFVRNTCWTNLLQANFFFKKKESAQ